MASSGPQEKKAIPRFASFKPPAPPVNDRPPELISRERVEPEERSKHRPKHHSRHSGRHERRRSRSRDRGHDRRDSNRHRKESNRRDKELVREATPPSRNVVKEPTDSSSELYVIDRKGDKYNLIYGTLHRYSVPNYYRIGRGRVLGLPPNYRIDRETIGENEITVKSGTTRTDSSKFGSKRLLSRSEKFPPRLLRVKPTSPAEDPITSSRDFVPLRGSSERIRGVNSGASDTEDEKYGYRSIHGKLKPEEALPSDVEPVSESELSGEASRQDPDWEIKQRNVELSRGVKENPGDVDAWLQLIHHQETVLRGSTNQSSSLTGAEQNSLADIKLSLYEKALKGVGKNIGRDRLLIGFLDEGSKLWDTKKLLAQWHSTLKTNPGYISLWVKYLDFRQTEFLNFTYRRCLATFAECLRLNKTSPDGPDKVRVQMYLFLRLTLFLREAGYMEQAIALWQGILELYLFFPRGCDITANDKGVLSAFADFWDSEVARIGEIGAKGWKNNTATMFEPREFQPQCRLNRKSMLESWAMCEWERMLSAQLPARSLDEPEDDPYRVVLASDLTEFLSLGLSPNLASEMAGTFLYFCQLPPMITMHNIDTAKHRMDDSFLQNSLSAASYASLNDWLSPSHTRTESSNPPNIFSHQRFVHDFDTYFADSDNWYLSFSSWLKATPDPAVRDWSRRTLRLLVDANSLDEDLAVYAIAVEFVCDAKEAKKYAKSLLKKRSSSLRLYNAYALMERRSGNHAGGDHVWTTAISMSKSLPNDQKIDCILLWHTWIWELLEARNIALVAHILVSIPQNHIDLKTFPDASTEPSFSATNLLKIRNFMYDVQESAIANRNPSIIKACTDCQAILSYISDDRSLFKSLEAYTTTVHRLSSLPKSDSTEKFMSYTTELLHQARARLLYYHVRTSTLYKPSGVRAVLQESLTSFEHNTIFLTLFAWNESRFRIEERVRDILRDITTASTSQAPSNPIPLTTHLFSIYTELKRPTYAGSTLHSARAAFEKAVGDQSTSSSSASTSTGRTSITLWKLYIFFEISQRDITRAKGVFYRALRACPWSKDILMLAFTHLREDIIQDQCEKPEADLGHSSTATMVTKGAGMNFHELRHVYNVLVEKELRIHIDIERYLDEIAVKMEQGGEGLTLGMGISMPDDVGGDGDEDEVMQM
ncbi:NRDE-2, necessary for RNA interference-domain-containing protein [Aspergillus unguis]